MNTLAYQPMQLLLTRDRKPLANRKPTTKPRRAKRFKHVYVDVEDLGRHVGVEFTFIAGGYDKDEVNMDTMAGALRPAFAKRLLARKVQTKKVTLDPQCIEAPSEKIKSRKEFRTVARHMHEVAASLGMVGHTDWHGGGGAHIHVCMKAHKKPNGWGGEVISLAGNRTCKALLLDSTHRPYVNWAFSNPGDTENTHTSAPMLEHMERYNTCTVDTRESLTADVADAVEQIRYVRENGRYYMKAYIRTARNYMEAGEWDRRRALRHVLENYRDDEGATIRRWKAELKKRQEKLAAFVDPDTTKPAKRDGDKDYDFLRGNMGKCYGITAREEFGTVEFRIFQAPNDAAEHELQLNFALAYVEWAEAQAKAGMFAEGKAVTLEQQAAEWTLEKSQKAFLKFVGMIGLKPNKYKRYLANMARRYELVGLGKGKLN